MARSSERGRFGGFEVRLAELVSWRGILVLAVAGALLTAALLVAAGLFLLLLPLFIVAGLVGRFFFGRRRRTPERSHRPALIEGEYEVVRNNPDPGPPRRGWGPR
jgi:membrane protein implicated in regulation of membrane protease activity